jgi:tight adherence protein C
VVDAPDRGGVDVSIPSLVAPTGAALTVVFVGARIRPRAPRPVEPVGSRSGPGSILASRWRAAVAVVASLIVVVVAGPLVLGSFAAGSMLIRRLGPVRAAARRRAAVDRALPEAQELLVLSVRAGLTPIQAVSDLATFDEPAIGGAFAEVVRRTERGRPFADALAALPEHLGPRAGGLADVIATSDRHGLPLGPMLDQLTDEVRSSRRRLEQAEARKLPVRLSFPLVACTLPSFVLLAIAPAVIAALSSLGGTAW